MKPFKIFYSYSHKDEGLKEQLDTHLSILKRNSMIDDWHDRKITPGDNWSVSIDNELRNSEIVLLLISADFIASEYCYSKEMKLALELHETGKTVVIPLFIRPVEWGDSPFSMLQGLPKDALAVTSWQNQDEAWVNIVKGIKDAIAKRKKARERSSSKDGLIGLKEIISKEFERIGENYKKKSVFGGLPSGYDEFDRLTDGLHQYDIVIIGGRPGSGKTDFALSISNYAACIEKLPVAFFSLKHPADVISHKVLSNISTIPSYNLLRMRLKDEEWPILTRAVGMSTEMPLYIDDRPDLKIKDIEIQIEKLCTHKKLSLIIIDNLANLKSNEQLSIDDISQKLIVLARKRRVPIICLLPLPVEVEQRVDKRPYLKDLGEWQRLGDDSSLIAFLYRDELYNRSSDNPMKGLVEVILAKNNRGPTSFFPLAYFEEKAIFHNLQYNDEL